MSARELDALTASSNHLLNLQAKLTKAQRSVPAMPQTSPLSMRVSDRFMSGVLTRGKKSTLSPNAVDRITSEFYPVAAARVDFFPGTNTRLNGRDSKIVYR